MGIFASSCAGRMSFAHLAALLFLGLTRPSITARLKVVKQHSKVRAHKTAAAPTQEEINEAKSATSESDKAITAAVGAWEMFQDKDGKMTLAGAKEYLAGMTEDGEGLWSKFVDLLFQPDAPEGLSFVEFAKRWIALHRGDAVWTESEVPAKYNWFSILDEIPEDAPLLPSDPVGNVPRHFKFATPTLTEDSLRQDKNKAAIACCNAWDTFVCDAEDTGVENGDAWMDCRECGPLWCGDTLPQQKEEKIEKCTRADLSKNFPWHKLIPEP